jgi:hypothetical protein
MLMNPPRTPEHNSNPSSTEWPVYLHGYEELAQHFRAQLEGLNTTEKGRRFAHLVRRLVPLTDWGAEYYTPEINSNISNDEGIDLTARAKHGTGILYIQAKLWLDRADDLDSVFSKFEAFAAKNHSAQQGPQLELVYREIPIKFLLVTLSKITNIVSKYRSKSFSSRSFYDRLLKTGSVITIDGEEILAMLRSAYLKLGEIPQTVSVQLADAILHKDNVYLSIISSNELKKLYQKFGDALFFENVRDFMEPATTREQKGRTTPNLEIIKTVVNEPNALLARNNGIVFRAEAIIPNEKDDRNLLLTRGSIVNGCQTTMCVVLNADRECFVPVKLVQTGNAWDVAKAANYQNAVNDIDLELARHLRPQVVKRAANISGVKIEDGKDSAFHVVDSLYSQRVAYQETRLLYIGLFSRQPNNLYASNYTEINSDLISRFYRHDQYGVEVFETLFALQNACILAVEGAERTFANSSYSSTFERFYKEDSPTYRCFVAILALCGAIGTNVADRKQADSEQEFIRMAKFVSDAGQLLASENEKFLSYYRFALKIWMTAMMDAGNDDGEIRQLMSLQSRKADFSMMYKKLLMEADLASEMAKQ